MYNWMQNKLKTMMRKLFHNNAIANEEEIAPGSLTSLTSQNE